MNCDFLPGKKAFQVCKATLYKTADRLFYPNTMALKLKLNWRLNKKTAWAC